MAEVEVEVGVEIQEVEEAGKASVNVRIVRKVSMITKTSVLRVVGIIVDQSKKDNAPFVENFIITV